MVFLVPKGEPPPDLAGAIVSHVEQRLGRAFRPAVHVMPELPKTRSLKIMRRVIRNLYTGQPPGDLSALDNPTALPPLQALAG